MGDRPQDGGEVERSDDESKRSPRCTRDSTIVTTHDFLPYPYFTALLSRWISNWNSPRSEWGRQVVGNRKYVLFVGICEAQKMGKDLMEIHSEARKNQMIIVALRKIIIFSFYSKKILNITDENNNVIASIRLEENEDESATCTERLIFVSQWFCQSCRNSKSPSVSHGWDGRTRRGAGVRSKGKL